MRYGRKKRGPAFGQGRALVWQKVFVVALSADDPDRLRLGTLLALRDLELDALSVLERLVAVGYDRREVNENVLAAVYRDEAVALLGVEPFDAALCHC